MQHCGGHHAVTAALCNAMAAAGMVDPGTGEALDEAMVLGIGGGLGAGYILWEFEAYDSALIVLGFRNRWNYDADFIQNCCLRLNVAVDLRETGGLKKAAANLDEALERSGNALLWVDKAHLRWHNLPESMKGHISHVVRVEADGGAYLVDDLRGQPYTISRADLAAARKPIPSHKQRSLALEAGSAFDMADAVGAGIADHIAHLSRGSQSFSLPVYQKWAKLMTNATNKKSWRVVFSKRAGLYTTLRTIYEWVRLDDTEGAGLRELYAGFLLRADAMLPADLGAAAGAYRDCGAAWRDFADCALDEAVPAFAETKTLLHARYAAYASGDSAALRDAMADLDALEKAHNLAGFPLDDAETEALFGRMAAGLEHIFESEKSALAALKAAMDGG